MPSLFLNPVALLTPRRCMIAAIVLYTLMIAIGAVPGKAQELSSVVPDKLLHFLAYALLTALLYGGLPGRPVICGALAFTAGSALGAIDEAIQALLPYREASWADWATDVIAALVCVSLMILLSPLSSLLKPRIVEQRSGRMQATHSVRPESR